MIRKFKEALNSLIMVMLLPLVIVVFPILLFDDEFMNKFLSEEE